MPYLCNHHVAIKGSLSVGAIGTFNMCTELGDYRGAKGHIRDEMSVHDIDLGNISGRSMGCSS